MHASSRSRPEESLHRFLKRDAVFPARFCFTACCASFFLSASAGMPSELALASKRSCGRLWCYMLAQVASLTNFRDLPEQNDKDNTASDLCLYAFTHTCTRSEWRTHGAQLCACSTFLISMNRQSIETLWYVSAADYLCK